MSRDVGWPCEVWVCSSLPLCIIPRKMGNYRKRDLVGKTERKNLREVVWQNWCYWHSQSFSSAFPSFLLKSNWSQVWAGSASLVHWFYWNDAQCCLWCWRWAWGFTYVATYSSAELYPQLLCCSKVSSVHAVSVSAVILYLSWSWYYFCRDIKGLLMGYKGLHDLSLETQQVWLLCPMCVSRWQRELKVCLHSVF